MKAVFCVNNYDEGIVMCDECYKADVEWVNEELYEGGPTNYDMNPNDIYHISREIVPGEEIDGDWVFDGECPRCGEVHEEAYKMFSPVQQKVRGCKDCGSANMLWCDCIPF